MELRDISIFKDLSDEDLSIIKENMTMEIKSFSKDTYIFRQGEVGRDLYYLISGSLLVYKLDSDGNRSIIQNFKDKVIFGEVYAYLNKPYDFSAQTTTSSKIFIVHDFKRLFSLGLSRDFLISYIDLISRKCLVLSQKNQISSQASLRGKIANFLLLNESGGRVNLKFSRDQRADFLGSSRPALSRELSKMDKEGILEVEGRKISILNRKALEESI